MDKQNINRRQFMQLGLGLCVFPFVDSLSRKLLAADSKNATFKTDLVTNGVVVTASHWGILNVKVKDGKVIESSELLQNGIKREITNSLTTTVADLIYNKSRIKYPMVRKSFLEGTKDNNKLRGKDEWVRLDYNKAIDLIAQKLKDSRSKKGAEGIFAGSYGWKSSGNFHNSITLLQRFMSMSGGFAGSSGDYSAGAAQIIMPYVVGTIEVYEQQTSWPLVLSNSKLVVIWGANPILTNRLAWTSSDGMGLYYFEQLKKSKIKTIVIDPLHNDTAKYLNSHWIAPRPNTDVAMIFGMIYELYTTKNYDKNFISNYTTGFDKFINYILGKDDGIVKNPKWASKITGLKENDIKTLAHEMYKTRTMIMAGWGIQRAHHGEQIHWALVTLACMLGQVGLPGGGFGFSYHYSNGGVPTTNGPVIGGISTGSGSGGDSNAWLLNSAKYTIPVARIADALLNPGKQFDFNGKKITYPDIDFIYWVGGNPFTHHQDTNKLVKAWQKPSTVVVHDMFWTPTARMADIVMPISTTYERNDITMSGDYSNKNIIPMKQVAKPQHESVSDYQVFLDLSKKFGIEKKFSENRSEMQWIETFYNQALDKAKASGVAMPDFKTFWNENKPLSFEVANDNDAEFVRYADFREDPILNPLGTPSGLIEIYSKAIEKLNYKDCKAHPTWFEPAEWLGSKNKGHKLHMISPHPKNRLHSQLNNTNLRKEHLVNGREPITINTQDAKRLHIKQGDIVRVFNERGQILAGAIVSNDIMPGVVVLHEGAWYCPKGGNGEDSNLCLNGSANCLTIDIPSSELASANIAQTALVNIEKYTKKADEVYVFNAI